MIVDPDFLTHWKTLMLVNELNDKAAPLYVIALWAHCQQRRSNSFTNLAPNALKAICRYEGEASKLRSALERCGWIDVNGEVTVAHGWAEANAKLIAQWSNGERGGRPPKEETQRKPNGNPTPQRVTRGLTDRVDREEKSTEESMCAREGSLPIGPTREVFERMKRELMAEFNRAEGDWDMSDDAALSPVSRRPAALDELQELIVYRKEKGRYAVQDLKRLLLNWSENLDKARTNKKYSEPTHANKPNHRPGYGPDRNHGIAGNEPGRAARIVAERKARAAANQSSADAVATKVAGP